MLEGVRAPREDKGSACHDPALQGRNLRGAELLESGVVHHDHVHRIVAGPGFRKIVYPGIHEADGLVRAGERAHHVQRELAADTGHETVGGGEGAQVHLLAGELRAISSDRNPERAGAAREGNHEWDPPRGAPREEKPGE